jgi:hypothetical protein
MSNWREMTSEDMENILLCIFQYLTVYYIITKPIFSEICLCFNCFDTVLVFGNDSGRKTSELLLVI